ncbi:hypothetical protein [Bacillus sp. NPDC077027]|uniref:hypothetical protein n=1 Tax=Bacillus sp. NPDC077027 TaxID=3390548 RepID=UPI003D027896
MDIKSPRTFETSDKAHADLFNEMVKVLLENDSGLLDQIASHINDKNPHVSESEKKNWNNAQQYKITADNGLHLLNIPSGGSIYDVIKPRGTCTFYAPGGSSVVDSPAIGSAAIRGIQLVGQNNIGVGIAIDTLGNAFWFQYHSNDVSINWTQLPTTADKNRWNESQLSKITADDGKAYERINANDPSILDKLLTLPGVHSWYIHEDHPDLPTRSSMRALSVFSENTYGWIIGANNTGDFYFNRSTTDKTGTKQEWSGWKRLNAHNLLNANGTRMQIPTGTDILTLPSGFYYAVGTNVTNMPTTNDSSWFNIDVIETGANRKTFHVIRSADNMHWFGTMHTDAVFRGWKRVLTDADQESTWINVELIGVKQYASNPLKYSVRQNILYLRGSFEIVPANEAVVARFAQKPSATTVFLTAAVGSYGLARFTLNTDGSLKFDGMVVNNDSNMKRFEFNEAIPLW